MSDKPIIIPRLSKKRRTMADVPPDSLVAALFHQELNQQALAGENPQPAPDKSAPDKPTDEVPT